jgi:hypothetical protein
MVVYKIVAANYELDTITELAEAIRVNLPDAQALIERDVELGHAIMSFAQENLAQSGLEHSNPDLQVAAACGAVAAIQMIVSKPGALDNLTAIADERHSIT